MKNEWLTLHQWIEESRYLVFFGGAGVSTASGVPDFRGKNGLYKQKREIPLEKILSYDFFIWHPGTYYDYVRDNQQGWNVAPNQAHIRLAELEQEGKLKAIVTQNADGLHQKAGSKNVLELHGNGSRFYCMDCGKVYPQEEIMQGTSVPHCTCGGLIRPGAVFFGESLNSAVLTEAVRQIERADVLIVGGTSLSVYPAAGLLRYYKGHRLALINESPTPYDRESDLLIPDNIAEVFASV